jgi:hypothetical protein
MELRLLDRIQPFENHVIKKAKQSVKEGDMAKKKPKDEEIPGLDKTLGTYVGDILRRGVIESGIDIDTMSPEDYQLIFGGMPTEDDPDAGADEDEDEDEDDKEGDL